MVVPGQRSLFAWGEVAVDADARWERIALDDTSWVDLCRGYLRGADTVLDVVVDSVPWQCGRRFMYDRSHEIENAGYKVRQVCRVESGSPATGSGVIHAQELNDLLDEAFAGL